MPSSTSLYLRKQFWLAEVRQKDLREERSSEMPLSFVSFAWSRSGKEECLLEYDACLFRELHGQANQMDSIQGE
ncbi:hypothetical protein PHISCL_04688 [Aspergillus sclerotialis]|uniref:Uncharacterized protein n=1 Tax=Aspergillus sclerotialis TaxID=2070753 RepID=A0A3A3A0W6_9EURO|nr:hypothetical protein PHISCL_04688 [Aspergillus sclerotialis]